MEARISQAAGSAHARAHITKSRGKVGGYSRHSKMRFRRQIWSLNDAVTDAWKDAKAHRTAFFTMTLPGTGSGWEEIDYRAALKTWREAVRYHFPSAYGYWCREYQKRGAVHYQGLLVFAPEDLAGLPAQGPPYYKEEICRDLVTGQWGKERLWYPTHGAQDWFQATWSRIIGQYARAIIEPLNDPDTGYLAKESTKTLSKDFQDGDVGGRWWGLINKEAVREAESRDFEDITPAELDKFQRHCRAYWTAPLKRMGKRYNWKIKPQPPNWMPGPIPEEEPPPWPPIRTSDVLPISTARVGESPRKPRSNARL